MSQQINLLNPALIKQKDLLNPNNIVISLVVLIVLMLAYYSYAHKQMALLSIQRAQVAEALTLAQTQLTQTATLHAPREANKALLEQIAQLEQTEKMQQQVLQTIQQTTASPEKGYAALMRAFAQQALDGLWLTGFSFDSHSDQLNINGRTLEADLVPEYITRLGSEPALKGKQFSALSMKQPQADAASNNKPSALAKAITTIAPNAAAALNKNNQSATTTTSTAAPEVPYIEFSLQSSNDSSEPNPPNKAINQGAKS